VFRSTLQGLNQSIVGLSPLSDTTYSTGHEIHRPAPLCLERALWLAGESGRHWLLTPLCSASPCESGEEEKRGRLTHGSHMSVKEKKKEEGTGGLGSGVSGLLGLAGPTG
jgi:hypothetical protein